MKTVTLRITEALRQKPYWKSIPESQTFEYLRDRAPCLAVLKDRAGRLVSVQKDLLVCPSDPVSELVMNVLTVPNTLDKSKN